MNKETKAWVGITAFCVICMIMKLYNEMLLDGLFYFGLSIVGGFFVRINYKNWKNENSDKRISYPSKQMIEENRKRFFNEIEQTVHIVKSDSTGFVAEVDDFDDSFIDKI